MLVARSDTTAEVIFAATYHRGTVRKACRLR